jgi:flagellar biosynthetic protein FliO
MLNDQGNFDVLVYILSVSFIFILLGLALYLIKKFIPNSGYLSNSKNFKILQSISIGVRQKLILVQFYDKKILLSSTPSSIRKIETLSDDNMVNEYNKNESND